MIVKPTPSDILINMDSMSNGHVINPPYDNHLSESPTSVNPLSTLFSSITSSFRPRTLSTSSYQKHSRKSDLKTSKSYQKQRNGDLKHHEKNFIYHQLNIHTVNDENNNQTKDEPNQNAVSIDIPSPIPSQSIEKSIFTQEHFIWLFLITVIYFSWFILIAGITTVHIVLYSILMILYLISDRTRRFALALLIYFTYLILYDTLHLVPNYSISKVHIRDVYLVEKRFFGIFKNGHLMTLNEYFKLNHIPFLDVFTGFCYLCW
jgi:hypothetical protein